MNADECKGYACPPSTTVDLPECEDGWEIGNGTAVCATQQPTSQPLAATGMEGADIIGASLGTVALLAVGIGLFLLGRAPRSQR